MSMQVIYMIIFIICNIIHFLLKRDTKYLVRSFKTHASLFVIAVSTMSAMTFSSSASSTSVLLCTLLRWCELPSFVTLLDSPPAAADSPLASVDSPPAAADSPLASVDSPPAAVDSPLS
jgi:hypothetical protein